MTKESKTCTRREDVVFNKLSAAFIFFKDQGISPTGPWREIIIKKAILHDALVYETGNEELTDLNDEELKSINWPKTKPLIRSNFSRVAKFLL